MSLILNIIFGGMINVLANKSIMIHGFTSWSVSVMISSLNDYYRKPVLNHVRSLFVSTFTTHVTENYSSKKRFVSLVQPPLSIETNII